MNFVKKNIPIISIIIFHLVGFFGFIFYPNLFKSLSSANIILSSVIVILVSKQYNWSFYRSLIIIAILGYLVEVLGVKTKLIFGSYYYGYSLGYKLFSVPLLIGVNWSVLLYCTAQCVRLKNMFLNALVSAFLMVFLDFFIEQNASNFDFWYWENLKIPLQNYIAWFLISFVFNLLVQKHINSHVNNTAKLFYITQLLFFCALYLFV